MLPLVLFLNHACCQEDKEEVFRPHHMVGIAISHAHVSEGRDENGEKKVLSLPAWSLDYTFRFHRKWAIGLHTDIIIEKFLVKDAEEEIIERNLPVAPAILGIFQPGRHLSFLFGAGAEFSEGESFFLTRIGTEYGAELPKGWEVFGALTYDIKWRGYGTWLLGLGIAKKLGSGKSENE